MEQQGFVDTVPSDRPNCPYAVFPSGATADCDELEVKVKMIGAIALKSTVTVACDESILLNEGLNCLKCSELVAETSIFPRIALPFACPRV